MLPSFMVLMLTLGVRSVSLQAAAATNPSAEAHIHEVMNGLSRGSDLYKALSRGARGDGVHYPWMDEMKNNGIKKVKVSIDVAFDRHGRPKQMRIRSTEYFSHYDSDTPISDSERLNTIRAGGLERTLNDLALQRTAKGFWLDVPRPRPRPFVGGAQVEFLDDEWLPEPDAPMFYARAGGQSHR